MKRYLSYFQVSLSNAIPEASEVEIKSGEYFANDTFDVGIYVIWNTVFTMSDKPLSEYLPDLASFYAN